MPIPKVQTIGGSLLGPQTRRDFLKRLVGAAVSAAVPKLPEKAMADGLPPIGIEDIVHAPHDPFVTDPAVIKGFVSGARTYGVGGKNFNHFWVDEPKEVESFRSGGHLRDWLKSADLGTAMRTPTPAVARHLGDGTYIPAFEWNSVTKKWHPMVAMPNKDGSEAWKYLKPGEEAPPGGMNWEYWYDRFGPEHQLETEIFDSPDQFSEQMLSDWRRHKVWEMQDKGPDSKELAEDPELRKDYLRYMSAERRAPGGRFDPLAGLTASREVELPIDQPRQPAMSKVRRAAAAAPFLAVPLLAPREEE